MHKFKWLLVAIILVGTLSVSAEAQAKPGKPPASLSTNQILLNESDPHLGDVITFSWSAQLTGNQSARIQVACSQDGVMVYGGAAEARQQFLLGGGSSDWLTDGGPADCEATLYYWDFQPVQRMAVLAVTTFHAGGLR